MHNQKLIIFDFFGVISSEVAPRWLEKYFDKQTAQRIKEQIVSQVDSGNITEYELYQKLAELANVSAETVQKEWKNLVKIDSNIINFIKDLKKDYVVALLSNASYSFLKRILDENNLNNLFDIVVISGKERMVKPNIEIYNLVLNKTNIKPADSLMIDDNLLNIEGAKKAGIEGILYTNFDSFIKEIEQKI